MAKVEKKKISKKVVDRSKGKPFQKGHTVNKDRPQYDREERLARTLDNATLFRILNLHLHSTKEDLTEVANDPNSTMLERMVTKCLLQGLENKSVSTLDYFLSRIVGKVPDKLIMQPDNPFKDLTLEEMKAKHAELAKSNRQTFDNIMKDKKQGEEK